MALSNAPDQDPLHSHHGNAVGPEAPGNVNASVVKGAPAKTGDTDAEGSLPLTTLMQKHPSWDGQLMADLDALYCGGQKIHERVAQKRLLFKRAYEPPDFWSERKKRLHYFNYMGPIIGYYAAATFLLRPEFRFRATEEAPEPEKPDAWYDDFFSDCDRSGTDFVEVMKERMAKALTVKRAYLLVDRPRPTGVFTSIAEQEEAGDLDVYLAVVDPLEVIDWDDDQHGNLVWCIRYTVERRRAGPESVRSEGGIHRWSYYGPDGFRMWELVLKKDETLADMPEGKKVPEIVPLTPHALGEGKLPMLRLQLSDDLWVGSKLGDVAIAHLNKNSALDWSHITGLMRMPVVATDNMSTHGDGENPQGIKWGSGHFLEIGQNDSVSFLEPSGSIDGIAADALDRLKNEMYRIVHQMAQAITDQSAVNAPAEGKRRDAKTTVIMCRAYGHVMLEFMDLVMDAVSLARGQARSWASKGLETFDDEEVTEMLAQAGQVSMLSIPSPTFQSEYYTRIALAALPDADDQMKTVIREEISEGMVAKAEAADALAAAGAKAAFRKAGEEDEEDDIAAKREAANEDEGVVADAKK